MELCYEAVAGNEVDRYAAIELYAQPDWKDLKGSETRNGEISRSDPLHTQCSVLPLSACGVLHAVTPTFPNLVSFLTKHTVLSSIIRPVSIRADLHMGMLFPRRSRKG